MVRQELLSIDLAASLGGEVLARSRRLCAVGGPDGELLVDPEDMFDRVDRMTSRAEALLAGVIELYRTRTDTKVMIAMERLAATRPITAIAGRNMIVTQRTHVTSWRWCRW